MGCHSLLQGIFLTQGSNPGLLHWRQILYRLSHQGSPAVLEKPQRYFYVYPLRQNQDPAPRLHYCFLAAPALSLLPLSSLLSSGLNLTFGIQGKSWRLEPVPYEQRMKTTERLPGTPKGPAWLQKHCLHCRFQSHCTLALCLGRRVSAHFIKNHSLDISLPGSPCGANVLSQSPPAVRLLAAASR